MATALASTETQHLFVTGLLNAHAVEHQALALMNRQLEHLENYPEVADALRVHHAETEQQITRIDEILAGLGEKSSAVKDTALTFTGSMAALAHVFAPDEVLKNQFANHAFENFEIAAYTSLLELADLGDHGSAVAPLKQSLAEEQRMAGLVLDSIPALTRKFAALRSAGQTASH